jgi:endonuclease YncB( thermonuclease family)
MLAMNAFTSVLSAKLERTGLPAGAFFLLSVLPAIALTGATLDGPPLIAGLGRVIDGDTLDVGQIRVRLEGIDAPELAQACTTAGGESWQCGRKAAAFLRSLAQNKDLICDQTGTDKYQRSLAVCYTEGININEAMVRAGFAWAFVRYSTAYVTIEAEARAQKLGIWQGSAEAPWDFRRDEWKVAEIRAPKGCIIKGNISSHGRIYHTPWSPWYDKVKIDEQRGERWFCTEAEALAAGWRQASPN